jgi:hypothetical protein
MLFSKLEDGDTSPTSGTLAAFNCQDQGTFTTQLNFAFNGDGTLNTTASGATIKLVLEEANDGGAVTSFNNQDNLTWSTDNLLFTQEDADTKQIWQLDPSNPNARFHIATVTGAAGESSGSSTCRAIRLRPGQHPADRLRTRIHWGTTSWC